MRCFPLAVAAALLALVAMPAPAAADCGTTSPSVSIPSGDSHPFLLATNKVDQGIALYRESNQKGGLQRSDAGHDDTCNGLLASDELVRFVGLL